eukprot:COSAG01_NODE_212_length_21797_cov_14.197806_12_plen_228_part_00
MPECGTRHVCSGPARGLAARRPTLLDRARPIVCRMVQRRALLTVALLSSLLPRQVSGTTVPDLTIRTSSDCSAKSPCGQCQGECDADNECEQGLSCLERHGRQPVPGCRLGGQGDLADHAYCHVTPGGAENAPQKKQQQKKKAAQRTSRKQCTGLLDSNLPVSEILREIRACGFAYISPGWLPTQYVAEAYEFAKRYDGASKDACAPLLVHAQYTRLSPHALTAVLT